MDIDPSVFSSTDWTKAKPLAPEMLLWALRSTEHHPGPCPGPQPMHPKDWEALQRRMASDPAFRRHMEIQSDFWGKQKDHWDKQKAKYDEWVAENPPPA